MAIQLQLCVTRIAHTEVKTHYTHTSSHRPTTYKKQNMKILLISCTELQGIMELKDLCISPRFLYNSGTMFCEATASGTLSISARVLLISQQSLHNSIQKTTAENIKSCCNSTYMLYLGLHFVSKVQILAIWGCHPGFEPQCCNC